MIRFIRHVYRYYKYYRYDVYVSAYWLDEFQKGHKDSLIIH